MNKHTEPSHRTDTPKELTAEELRHWLQVLKDNHIAPETLANAAWALDFVDAFAAMDEKPEGYTVADLITEECEAELDDGRDFIIMQFEDVGTAARTLEQRR